MPTPSVMPPGLLPERPLRVAKAIVRTQQLAASSIPRKALWYVLALGLGIAIAVAIVAQGRRETDIQQAWFWTPDWFAGELEADSDLATGNTTHHDSDDAFLKALADRLKPE